MRGAQSSRQSTSILMKAVIGVAAGAAAVYVFDKLDWFMYDHEDEAVRERTKAARPGGEAPAQVVASRIANALDLGSATREKLGFGIHYALGIGPGAAYAALHDRVPYLTAGRGALFGLTLFLVQDEVLNTMMKTAGKPQEYPWQAHARGLVSHLLYGFILDTLVRTADRAMPDRRAIVLTAGAAAGEDEADMAPPSSISRPPVSGQLVNPLH